MKKWQKVGLVLGAVWLLIVLLTYVTNPVGKRAFGKYVHSPVPKSVDNIVFEGSDWFGINPEPICYFRFSAKREDMERIAQTFLRAQPNDMFSPGGPPWFRPVSARWQGENFIRRGKRGREFLWIDPSRTNAYFLLFGV